MKKLRVATHNICHTGFDPRDGSELFPDHSYRNGYEAEAVRMMKKSWNDVYASFSADVIGVQEYYPWFDLAHTEKTDGIFAAFGYSVHDGGHGLALASKLRAEKVYELSFEPVSGRRRQKFYIDAFGTRIAVFNSHMSPRAADADKRRLERELLIEEMKQEEYFVSFGDYNARNTEEYGIFAEEGFPMANTGIATVRGSKAVCDNVIVSRGLRIENVAVFDAGFSLSDHAVLYAELIVP